VHGRLSQIQEVPLVSKRRLVKSLGWIQLIISILVSGAIVFGYVAYRASLDQFATALSSSIVSVSEVVGMTAETMDARHDLVEHTKKMLAVSRSLVNELNKMVHNQASLMPQYVESVRAVSAIANSLSHVLDSVGDKLMFPMPTGVTMHGIRPELVMSHPLALQANELKLRAVNIGVLSSNMTNISAELAKDGGTLGPAVMATTEQALNLLDESGKTLDKSQSHDLPKALIEMRSTSKNLRSISQQVDTAGLIGVVGLVIGLLLCAWLFAQSVSTIILADQYPASGRRPPSAQTGRGA
jgi:hypothetical protein